MSEEIQILNRVILPTEITVKKLEKEILEKEGIDLEWCIQKLKAIAESGSPQNIKAVQVLKELVEKNNDKKDFKDLSPIEKIEEAYGNDTTESK